MMKQSIINITVFILVLAVLWYIIGRAFLYFTLGTLTITTSVFLFIILPIIISTLIFIVSKQLD
ncbi:hypothetical protein ACFQ4N_11980 [Oceanobacillus iheyensis]|uniref:Uncharacterized protein n=1 Tax=Oceanobacillus iheyensis (strain DSM 14371 / CIP 107618 / JCM 11309 / KCTC 3954 / HTE831) TaxID=221109 RepID=Q8EQH4_OCEIH|nr:hypothetical protein [Oceanobacillus iheyensis]BAC13682.1 hypothetical protein [Oceanobacillus iheyensis HTE831]